MKREICFNNQADMEESLLSVRESLEILGGKWKIPILLSLACERKRFTDLIDQFKGLSPKVLAKELKELEVNNLVTKDVERDTNTCYYNVVHKKCDALHAIVEGLREWGDYHRSNIFQRPIKTKPITGYVKQEVH